MKKVILALFCLVILVSCFDMPYEEWEKGIKNRNHYTKTWDLKRTWNLLTTDQRRRVYTQELEIGDPAIMVYLLDWTFCQQKRSGNHHNYIGYKTSQKGKYKYQWIDTMDFFVFEIIE